MKSNIEIEKHYFELFSNAYAIPDGEVIYCDKPDVIIDGERKIGIEITNFFKDDGRRIESEQQQSSIRDKVLRNAKQQYLSNGGKPFDLCFTFDMNFPIKRKNKLIVRELIDLVKKIENLNSGEIPRNLHKHIPELESVYLIQENYTNPKWRPNQCYKNQDMVINRLKKIIKTKEKRINSYTTCDSYWLLIVADYIDPAQDQVIPDKIELKYDKYEKILIFKTEYREVVVVRKC